VKSQTNKQNTAYLSLPSFSILLSVNTHLISGWDGEEGKAVKSEFLNHSLEYLI
jgi:hypothetical protein